jgi:hypothetical protein
MKEYQLLLVSSKLQPVMPPMYQVLNAFSQLA